MTDALTQRETLDTDTPCADEGRDGVMLPQALKHQRWLANSQELGESLGQPLERTSPADALISDFQRPEQYELTSVV